ncbi:SDR family oxidoreductase [Polyangium fumosum]|uniref:SDR family oxidoreductase n=1 Tax=Polyangium fumosum TaxID=889272 RepID=A0A4U1J4R2_9BACT|nr:SDR family oxidoreductase [Polyangium fumosum]
MRKTVDLELQGSVVFVTGASGGIGNEICRAFLEEGASVVAFSRHGMPDGDPARAVSLMGDVRDPAAMDQAMRDAEARFGRVDVCVACAGIWPPDATPLHEMDPARARDVVETNLLGALWTARAFLASLARKGPREGERGASLVFVGSTAGRFGERGHSEYAASKAGLRGLMLSLKNEIVSLDPRGRVNLVEPGWTVTPMVEACLAQHGALETTLRTMPLQKLATPTDVARAVLFLSSPAMAGHLSGEALLVAGGMEGRVLW